MASLRKFILRWRHWRDLSSFVMGERDRRMRKARRRGKAPGAGFGEAVSVRPRGLSRPVRARLGTSDFMVIEDLLVHGAGDGRGEYDAAMDAAERVCGGAERVGLVLDLGANIGVASMMFAERFPQARIVAVEPDADNFTLLETNTRSGAGARTRCVRACVGAKRRMVTLDRSAHGGEPWAIAMKDEGEGEPVEVVTIEGLCMTLGPPPLSSGSENQTQAHPLPPPAGRGFAIDLLKCDIEGAEREVFESCAAWIGSVRAMVVELHAPYRRDEFLEHVRRGCGGGEGSMPFSATTLKEDAAIQVVLLERIGGTEELSRVNG